MANRTPTPARPHLLAAADCSPDAPMEDVDTIPGPCPCARAFSLDEEHHDWLVSFEERGLPGAVEVIQHLSFDADSDHVSGQLPWVDFESFVAMHNWKHPADVADLASFVDSSIRLRLGLDSEDLGDNGMTAKRLDALEADLSSRKDPWPRLLELDARVDEMEDAEARLSALLEQCARALVEREFTPERVLRMKASS